MKARQPEPDLAAQAQAPVQREAGSAWEAEVNASARTAQLRALADAVGTSARVTAQSKGFGGPGKGLPGSLKAGVEALSGMRMDHVQVHYNSARPAQMQAHAYAQGSDIHLGPGQEKHLPHEAWHVVQQAQGRVRPTMQLASATVNDDPALEHEADVMGSRALAAAPAGAHAAPGAPAAQRTARGPIQRVELRLPNGDAPWVVDSTAQFGDLVHWIGAQVEQNHGNALSALIEQLQSAPQRSSHDQFLLSLAITKRQEILEQTRPLMRAANPASIGNIAAFIAAQRDYQNFMIKNYSMAAIMQHHHSAGLEFEFATYTSGQRLDSHIVLAESAPFSTMFNLPFVLETDSGDELEIGFPPFLLRNSPTLKARIADLWLKMRARMAQIRQANRGQPIATLLTALGNAGLGLGWTPRNDATQHMQVANDRSKHSTTADQVYSQLNLSLGGAESAALIGRVAGQSERLATPYERELILPHYTAIHDIIAAEAGQIEAMSDSVFLHVVKTATSALAIPSIEFAGHGILRGIDTSRLFDLQSTVKELHGVWVKDSLPNILRTISPSAPKQGAALLRASRTQLIAYIRVQLDNELRSGELNAQLISALKARVQDQLSGLIAGVTTAHADAEAWFEGSDWPSQQALRGQLQQLDARLAQFIQGDSLHLFQALAAVRTDIAQMLAQIDVYREKPEDNEDIAEGLNPDGHVYLTPDSAEDLWRPVTALAARIKAIGPTLAALGGQGFILRLADHFETAIIAELDAAIRKLDKSKDFLAPGNALFHGQEQFGTGLGVRKDTHIRTLPANKSVAELRGDQIIREHTEH